MKRSAWAFVAAALAFALSTAHCFELATHAALTQKAFEQFLVERPTILVDLGLPESLTDPRARDPFGKHYFHIGTPLLTPPQRDADPFEAKILLKIDRSLPPTSITGWLMTGAIREDDLPWPFGDNPSDDPLNSNLFRVLNHFYDPVSKRPLTAAGYTAPDWATGSVDAFAQPNRADPNRLNHFTIFDAKEAFFRALTLKASLSGPWSDLPQAPGAVGKAALRNAYWATTFRALGDVLHLVQDMAQPQHTRNDAHAGIYVVGGMVGGHKSVFEAYLDARAIRANSFEVLNKSYILPTTTQIALTPLPLQTYYPTPTGFTKYGDFFSTSPGSPAVGKGLADYSNTQFFTAGKNIGNSEYASPPSGPYSITTVLPTQWNGSPVAGGSTAPVYLYTRDVVIDNNDHSYNAPNVPLTSISIWDEFMQGRALSPSFHLTRENYDAQANLLVPRAVAYSTGLLRFFFRGSMQIDLPDEGAYAIIDNAVPICKDTCGFSKIKLKLTNTTPNEMMGIGAVSSASGSLFAVVKFHRNDCYRTDLSGEPGGSGFLGLTCRSSVEEIVVSDPVDMSTFPSKRLAAGEQQPVKFTFATPIPINASDIYLQVIFRGYLGNEADAVLVATKNISEPNYITFENDTDYSYNGATDTFQAMPSNPTDQTFGSIAVKLGGAATPVATLSQLAPRGYARLAFLTDFGSAGTESVVVDFVSPGCCHYGSPWTDNLPIVSFRSSGGQVYDRTHHVSPYRGVMGDYRLNWFYGSAYSIFPCATGDTRRICTSAGLTAITLADAVAWTINFP